MLSKLNEDDNVVKNMAKEVVRDCGLGGMTVSYDAAIYLVNLKFLTPVKGTMISEFMDRRTTQHIIEECVKDFLEDDVWINTIKLQTYSESNLVDRTRIRKEHQDSIWKKSKPIFKEILEMNPDDKDGRDKLYKKLVLFTVVSSGLGNPTFNSVLREAQAALQSIFKYNELERFLALSNNEKERQLYEFTHIVNGIRLFNKDCLRGGDSIDDLPLILAQASEVTRERINNTIEQLMRRIVRLTSAFEEVYSLSDKRIQNVVDDLNLPSDFTASDVDKMKRILFMVRELEYYMKKLLLINEESWISITNLIDRFRETLLQLHDLVRYRSAIPTVQIYPLFIILSHIWETMQEEATILSNTNTFMVHLFSFNKYSEQTQLELALSSEIGCEELKRPITDAGVIAPRPFLLQRGVTIITGADITNLRESQFGGYCAWTLAVADGLLIPGIPEIGFLQYKGRLYTFSSATVAYLWGQNPDFFIINVFKLARTKLELVKILNIYDDMCDIRAETLSEIAEEEIIQNNVEVQTEIHPVESCIDRSYSFSIWELKRRALQLSHVINFQTKSQQTTNQSNFRASVGVQMNLRSCVSTQTQRDNSSNVPRISCHLNGLRGHFHNAFQALDFTT